MSGIYCRVRWKRLPNVKSRVINHLNEDFTKPSVIICNHQSHIDLMLIMMLSPRIVILTNEWVWNSPFYGNIVKNADFYPVINGIDSGIEHLSRLIEKGYSIMIFPEGTRSADCSINRFHRGAFFLAEQMKLDILPIMIHGMGHILPKTDFLMRKGEVTVQVLERITPEDKKYGESYSERARYVRVMYKNHYRKLVSEIETPAYYADKLFHNYVYKGSSVGAQVYVALKRHNNYTEIIKRIPDNGRVLVLGAGIGSFPLLLSMVKPTLNIIAAEGDEEKLSLAMNCASASGKVTYLQSSPLNFNFLQEYDTIVLVDCLSAFGDVDKLQIIKNCLSHSSLILLSDPEYSWYQKIRLKLSGCELEKPEKYSISSLRQISDGLFCNIIQTDNIFAISKEA
jgi:1-acyl-sn-glycerol-3-phosphate acyltransferase